ncbi:hypothetical protein AGOR_G00238440 [Albula goreensis]|uniref:E3 ubiquitin-protein ligase MSL2 n=1 Tax=Albula goreensis TaxID=1534307 RepID=A0A8T3CCR6_9TELE|nr:hypothetical protein AGOR_G00238440 [Albula goreensis]
MNPVNATALYVSASRSVLQCDPRDQQSLAELFKLLSFFRQSLSCLVCGNLLKDPVAPSNSSCQHYVCKACKGQKMTMKPSCSWCKNYEQFEDCKQVCILVECYRKLCEYVAVSPLAHQINSSIKDCPEVLDVLKEGLSLNESGPDESHVSLSLSLSHSPTPPAPEAECATKQEASEEPPDPVAEVAACLPDVNGLQNDCSGTGLGELGNGGPSPVEDVGAPVVTCSSSSSSREGLNPHSFPSALPVCEAESSQELCAEGIDVCGLGEDIKHSDGPLLLSVEEVLRSLDPEPEPVPVTPQYPGQLGHPNGPLAEPTQASVAVDSRPSAPGHPQPPSSGISCSAATPRPASRPNRKRSRSESDSEKVQPLPIASIILGPSTAAVAPVAVKREAVVPAQPRPQ